MSTFRIWCLLIGPNRERVGNLFSVHCLPGEIVDDLKEKVKEMNTNALKNVDPDLLTVWWCDKELNHGTSESLAEQALSAFVEEGRVRELDTLAPLSNPMAIYLVQFKSPQEQEHDMEHDDELIKKYNGVFARVRRKGIFEHNDIKLNNIERWNDSSSGLPLPLFVQRFQQRLTADRDGYTFPDYNDAFDRLKQLWSQAEYTERLEFRETAHVAHIQFETHDAWMDGNLDVAMNSEFFAPIARYLKSGENGRNIRNSFGEDSWTMTCKLAVKAEDTPEILSYGLKSNIAWWLGKYPRLLGEVYSKGSIDDRARLLVQGAFCMRLANLLLDEKKLSKEFINVLLYVDKDFKADLYLFFQNNPEKTNDKVFYSSKEFNLKERSSDGKAFLRELYNLADLMRQGDAILTILREEPTEFMGLVTRRFKQTFSGIINKPSNTDDSSGHAEEGNNNSGNFLLEERGYELLPVRLCDPMFKPPSHIYRVRQRTDIERHVCIAKKQARKSKELEIIRALNEKRPPCKNIIQLIDTVETSDLTYIILPELRSVDEQVYVGGGHLRGYFVDLGRDLVNGVVFMHNSGIAHLDIKPKNLVYDKDLRLQIIDFDTSVFAKDEEFLVRGYIGSEWWMAPEIGKEEDDEEDRPWYSPIRADRYSCGRVFEAFAKCQRRSDGGLRVFAEKLMDPNPQLRPKLTEWLELELMTGDEKSGRARSEDKTLVREVWSSESTKGMQRSHKRFRFEAGL
ncbi:hypothetical protein DFH05DRAFT_1097582 [Lentinula detonsa]|uniref:Protein kinase domain-containing protein n=1 Tax=Lentinula detonsa TaxID=2804962 RepID=A0A9W8P1N8_9AGAR|nr:hypothetical protein DFH05DRAFT_1097582 [Lentinula detonsa]